MKVLLSIKPIYAMQIEKGNKKYEYRRSIFNPEVNTVVVYASSPIQKIIGEFDIETILFDEIINLWNMIKDHAGIEEEIFFKYFASKEKGYAIKIKHYKKYKTPLRIKKQLGIHPPQSFLYLNQFNADGCKAGE